MSRKKIPSKQALIGALNDLDGNMAAAARRFHCSRELVRQHVERDPALRELVDQLSESFTDECEAKLFEKIRDGDTACIIFYMKTRARDRGYSERLELLPLQRQDIQIELGNPDEIETDHAEALNGHATAIALLEQ